MKNAQAAAVVAAGMLVGCSAGIPETGAGTGAAYAARAATTRLPVDDYRYTTSGPKATWVYSCQSFPGGGPTESLPWVDGSTWNLAEKVSVEGAVSWPSRLSAHVEGAHRVIGGNGLPSHSTGVFPISSSDPAYRYDQNPNSISAQTVSYEVPARPAVAATPSCLNMGPIGIMKTGAVLYNAFDAMGRDAAVHELLDSCWGHPQQQGQYHYHTYSSCMGDSSTGHSKLLGYALDGFGIYGPRGQDGVTLTSKDLDACHGHTHAIVWNGKRVTMYHYHFTYDFPYSLGCYRGTPSF